MKSEKLELIGLRKSYGDVQAVAGVDLTVEPGTVVTLLGPSGCGKTTLLRMIAGFASPTAGTIRLGEADITGVPANRRDIGVVFQNYALFPHLTVAGNVGFGLKARGIESGAIQKRVLSMLTLVKLEQLALRYPGQLSGGQQQRAAVARALAIDPRLLLLDEPLSALDKNLRQSVQQELRSLQRRLGVTTIVVTHDQEEAFVLSDLVAVMNAGCIMQIGRPQEIYDRPNCRFVADFLGTGNMVRGTIEAGAVLRLAEGSVLPCPLHCLPGQSVDLFFRPERLRILPLPVDPEPGAIQFEATLREIRAVGGRLELEAELSDGTRIVSHRYRDGDSSVLPGPGQTVRAIVAADSFSFLAV